MALLVLLAAAGAARADEVVFRNGDRVSGGVTRKDGKITITGTIFGTVTADQSEVASIIPTTRPATTTTSPTATAPATLATAPTTKAATRPATVAAAPPPPPPPAKTERSRWSGSISGTFLATRGNSETETFRAAFDATRKGEHNILTLNGGYAFGRTEDRTTGDANTTTDNWFAQGKLDRSLGERWYDYAMVRVEADYVADLDIRITPGVGVGYRWINKPEEHFNTEGGLTWVYEKYRNDGENDHVAVRLHYHYDKKLNDKVSFVHNVTYLPDITDPKNFNLSADAGLRSMLTKTMFAEIKAEWQHDSTPAPGAEYNDFRYIIGVGWKF
jgi:putative salt-induced outer membrane protein YdiY